MIENSLTYQFPEDSWPEGTPEIAPERIIFTRVNGAKLTYVPEVVDLNPGPVFKPGQIVQVTNPGDWLHKRYGVIKTIEGYITVIFGNREVLYPDSGDFLEIIHEVP